MSYTGEDVIEQIFQGIKNDLGIWNIKDVLIRWYEKQKSYYEVNNWDITLLNEKIRLLKSKTKD